MKKSTSDLLELGPGVVDMATPMRSNNIEQVLDEFDCLTIDSPCTIKASSSRLRGRVKGKVLFPATKESNEQVKWSQEEFKALISFLMLYTDGKSWIAHKDSKFWDQDIYTHNYFCLFCIS